MRSCLKKGGGQQPIKFETGLGYLKSCLKNKNKGKGDKVAQEAKVPAMQAWLPKDGRRELTP